MPSPLRSCPASAATALLLFGALAAQAQIELEDRRLQGHVGFTNTVNVPPEIRLDGSPRGLSRAPVLEASSVGRADVLDNEGPLFEDGASLPGQRAHEVVVEAFGGDYWLSVATWLDSSPSQTYVFGYAAHEIGAPGHPTFRDAWIPVTQAVSESDPDPIVGVDVLECAGRLVVHFVEEDPSRPGEYRPTNRVLGATIEVNPRLSPAATRPRYVFARGPGAGSVRGGSQARVHAPAGTADQSLWARASEQGGAEAVRVQVSVRWWQDCTLENPECPMEVATVVTDSYFEGVTSALGSLSGHVESEQAQNPGISVPCDAAEPLHLYLVVTPCMPPCPPPTSSFEGCVNLIGEDEILWDRFNPNKTSVRFDWSPGSRRDEPITNEGEALPPGISSGLFEAFDAAASEGVYSLPEIPALQEGRFAMQALLGPHPGAVPYHQSFVAFVPRWRSPAEGLVGVGADLCLVPGIYRGRISLRDAAPGADATGGMRALIEDASALIASGDLDNGFRNLLWTAARDHRGGLYDPVRGSLEIDYENVFAGGTDLPIDWVEDLLRHSFRNPSPDPSSFLSGEVRTQFLRPDHAVRWDAWEHVSLAAGGTWPGPLLPGTEISEREQRVVRADFELCFSKLRMQVRSQTVEFFAPRIESGSGTHLDDRGTPDPTDDIEYSVEIDRRWSGNPRDFDERAREGVVNLHLPAGSYERLGGFITTVLDPDTMRLGTTALPETDLELGCGQSCGVATNPDERTPLAIVCLDPIAQCNDEGVLAGVFDVTGSLFHQDAVARGYWRINDGAEVDFDLATAGVTCTALPCTDAFRVTISDDDGLLQPCLNRIEIAFVDETGLTISAFLDTRIDDQAPELRVSEEPDAPAFPCGGVQLACEGEDVPLPVARDDCSTPDDVDSRLVLLHDRPETFPPGDTRVTYRAIDGCGNETTCEVLVRVGGEGEVLLDCPEPLALECSEPGGVSRDDPRIADWLARVSVEAGCGEVPVVSDDAPAFFPSGCDVGETTTVTFWTLDSAGRRIECTSSVTVRDTTAPELTVPAPLVLECSAPGGVPADDPRLVAWLSAATAFDACGDVTPTHDAPSLFPSGCSPGMTTVVLFRAEDACGHLVEGESSVTVVDSLPPRLDVPPPIVIECTSPGGTPLDGLEVQAWLALAVASDDCGEATLTHDAPALLPAGCEPGLTTVVTFVAEDECGNTTTAQSSITVVDSQGPVIDRQPGLGGPVLLWPPQHGYVVLSVEETGIEAHDACGDVVLAFTSCASSQPEDNQGDENAGDGGDGTSACDCAISPDGQLLAMRAERDGGCAPLARTYSVTMSAIDECGHVTPAEPFTTCVPHDRGRGDVEGAVVLRPAPGSHQRSDLCAEGWINGSYPLASSGQGEPRCGEGCRP